MLYKQFADLWYHQAIPKRASYKLPLLLSSWHPQQVDRHTALLLYNSDILHLQRSMLDRALP